MKAIRQILFLCFFLGVLQIVSSLEPGDEWDFSVLGYDFYSIDSEETYFLPADYPDLVDGIVVQVDPNAPRLRSEVTRINQRVDFIRFKDERFLEVFLEDGTSYEGVFWQLEVDYLSSMFGNRFPMYILEFIDEERETHTYTIVVGPENRGYVRRLLPRNQAVGLIYVHYRIDFQDSDVPVVPESDMVLPKVHDGL